ncbi:hypothetical protein Bp8pS_247 [Bacillus phage vB_BpuM-BpSp]|nr:hypothetical protein Bp8pS_247 [Bacillus phage vB_BpuM-BpSp]
MTDYRKLEKYHNLVNNIKKAPSIIRQPIREKCKEQVTSFLLDKLVSIEDIPQEKNGSAFVFDIDGTHACITLTLDSVSFEQLVPEKTLTEYEDDIELIDMIFNLFTFSEFVN